MLCNWQKCCRRERKKNFNYTKGTFEARNTKVKWSEKAERECLFMIAWFHLSIILKYKLFISFPPFPQLRKNILNEVLELIKVNCFAWESLGWVIIQKGNFHNSSTSSLSSVRLCASKSEKSGAINQRNNQQIIIWLTERKMGKELIKLLFLLPSPQHASTRTINNSIL